MLLTLTLTRPPATDLGFLLHKHRRASFGRRLVAALVDGILLGIIEGIVIVVVGSRAASAVTLLKIGVAAPVVESR